MKIGTKLYLGFGLTITMTIILGLFALSGMKTLSDLTENMYRHPLVVGNTAREIKLDIMAMDGLLKDIIQSKNNAQRKGLEAVLSKYEQEVMNNFLIINNNFLDESSAVKYLQNIFIDWKTYRTAIIKLIADNKNMEKLNVLKLKNNQHVTYMLVEIDGLIDTTANNARNFLIEAEKERKKLFFIMSGLLAAIIILGLLSSVFITQSIIKPLNLVVKKIKNLAGGDLEETVDIFLKDEIGVLADSFRELQNDLHQRAAILHKIAAGDLSSKIHIRSEKDELGKAFLAMSSSLTEATTALADSELKYSHLFNSIPIGISATNIEGKINAANKTVKKMLGFEADLDFTTYNTLEFYYNPDDRKKFLELLKNGSVKNFEIPLKRKDGSRFWGSISSIIQKSEKNEILFINSIIDITQKRNIESSLKASEEHLRSLFSAMDDIIFVIDNNNCFSEYHHSFNQEGYTPPEDFLGRNYKSALPEPVAVKLELAIKNNNKTQRVQNFEYYLEISGVKKWYSANVNKIENKGSYIVVCRNITNIKKAEEDLKKESSFVLLLQKIAATANEASTIEEAMQVCLDEVCTLMDWPVGHVYLPSDDDNEVLIPTQLWHMDNPEKLRTFREVTEKSTFKSGTGLPGKILASKQPSWIVDINNDPEFLRTKLVENLEVKTAFGFPVLLDTRVVAVLEFFSKTVTEPDKKLLDVMANIGKQLGRVEERTRAREILKKSLIEAESANIAKSNFLSSISHELRTPLNAILGFSQILEKEFEGNLNETQKNYVSDILGSGKHLLSLINDILDLSKIEEGKSDLKLEPLDIKELLSNSLVMIRENCITHNITLKLDFDISLDNIQVTADSKKIKQIMYNLLSNAVKFTPDNGTILLKASKTSDSLEVSITDSGIGIEKEDQKKIFQKFFQTEGGIVNKTKGTGLGLNIVKNLVELHGGKITLKSEGRNKGTTFKFTIPLREKNE